MSNIQYYIGIIIVTYIVSVFAGISHSDAFKIVILIGVVGAIILLIIGRISSGLEDERQIKKEKLLLEDAVSNADIKEIFNALTLLDNYSLSDEELESAKVRKDRLRCFNKNPQTLGLLIEVIDKYGNEFTNNGYDHLLYTIFSIFAKKKDTRAGMPLIKLLGEYEHPSDGYSMFHRDEGYYLIKAIKKITGRDPAEFNYNNVKMGNWWYDKHPSSDKSYLNISQKSKIILTNNKTEKKYNFNIEQKINKEPRPLKKKHIDTKGLKCPQCSCLDFDHDHYWDELVCKECGWAIKENISKEDINQGVPLIFCCPHCGKEYNLSDYQMGIDIFCSNCKQQLSPI